MLATPPQCRAALAALLEERSGPAARDARRHVDECPRCADAWERLENGLRLQDASSSMLVGPHDGSNALAERALAAVDRVRPASSSPRRLGLALVATAQLCLALPWLFGNNPYENLTGHAPAEHLTRDGALGVAVAVAGLLTAFRPRFWPGMVGVAAAAGASQLAAGLLEGHSEHTHLRFEAFHLLGVVIVALVAYAGRPRRPAGPNSTEQPPSGRHLRSIR